MNNNIKLGFIGGGNMGRAIIKGVIQNGLILPTSISAFDTDTNKLNELSVQTGINAISSINGLAKNSDMLILAVKPNVVENVISDISNDLNDKSIISIVAGLQVETLKSLLPSSCRVLRVMPNMPAMVGEGMTVLDSNNTLTDQELNFAKDIFNAIGKTEILPTYLMDAVTGVSGSGPAYAFIFIEAMADAAVLKGIPRDIAYTLAAQTLLGSATAVLESGEHPAVLKDRVCSPGGTTIEAVYALETGGFRASIIDAVDIATEKSKDLGKK